MTNSTVAFKMRLSVNRFCNVNRILWLRTASIVYCLSGWNLAQNRRKCCTVSSDLQCVHSGESICPILYRCALNWQWPVCKRKSMTWYRRDKCSGWWCRIWLERVVDSASLFPNSCIWCSNFFLSPRVANNLLLGTLFVSFLQLVSSWQTLQFCRLSHFLGYHCGLVSTLIRFFVG